MAELKDLFVTYYGLIPKKKETNIETVEVYPSSRWQRFLDYMNNRTTSEKPSETEEVTEEASEKPQSKKSEEKKDEIQEYQNFLGQDTSYQVRVSNTELQQRNGRYSNKQQWVDDLTSAYKRAGLNDNAIKNLIAKNSLESAWGRSIAGDYNYGNITTGSSWTGNYREGRDKDSEGNPITQRFRSYNDIDEYVQDEIQFLTRLYDFDQDDDISTFTRKLLGKNSGKRRYAEDPLYASKLISQFNQLNK